jgi:hypothetical protein
MPIIEQSLQLEVKPTIELLQHTSGYCSTARVLGSVSPLDADIDTIRLRADLIRRSLTKLMEQGALHPSPPRDIDIAGMLTLRNCTQILYIRERDSDIEIRFLQMI